MSSIPASLPFRRRIRWGLPAVFAASAFAGIAGTSVADARVVMLAGSQRTRTDARIAEVAAKRPARLVDVIVQFNDGVSSNQGRAIVRALRGRHAEALPIVRGISARMRAADALRLVKRHGVRAVTLDGPVHSQSVTVPTDATLSSAFDFTVGAFDMWPRATGKGVGVAVIDTGIDGDLPDFRTSSTDPTSRVIASAVTNPGATTAADTYGHGTHVAGVIAGNGASRPDGDRLAGRFAGVAPEANLISIKAADDNGNASVADVLWGIQFALQHRTDMNIRVLNLSLASSTSISYKYDPLDIAVEAAWMQGIVVVAAAGNRGTAPDAVQYAPANDPLAVTVGAVDENGTQEIDDDTIATFSSRGKTQDGVTKPEIYAPGTHVISLLAPGSAFASMCPDCIVDAEYIRAGGTSMAAPVVSGAAALLLQLHPDWTPDQVKGALQSGAVTTREKVGELDLSGSAGAKKGQLNGNNGVKPSATATWVNTLINQYGWLSDSSSSASVDPARSSWSRSSWSRSSWSAAAGDLVAEFARSSWSCNCSSSGSDIDGARSSWGSSSSWSSILEG